MAKLEMAEVQLVLGSIRQQLNSGTIFDSCFERLDRLCDNEKRSRRTAIDVVDVPENFTNNIYQLVVDVHNNRLKEVNVDSHLIQQLEYYSGSYDENVRTAIIAFIEALLEKNQFSKIQLKHMFDYFSAPETMYSHINEPKTIAVCQRSISLEIIKMLLISDQAGYFFLKKDDIEALVNKMALVMVYERDTRGFINYSGWVNVFATMGAILSELCKREELTRADKTFLTACLLVSYSKLATPITMGEDEEIANFLVNLLKQHDLYQELLMTFVDYWRKYLDSLAPNLESSWHQIFNFRHLMQSLIFNGDIPDKVMKKIVSD